MIIIDISWPISPEMTAYKDKKQVRFEQNKNFERDGVRDSTIVIGSHSGTHVDAPSHFLADGESIDQVPLSSLMGPCVVLDLLCDVITAHELKKYEIGPEMIVLFKTRNSLRGETEPFNPEFVYLDASGAQYLIEKGVVAVGIDYLGIERGDPAHSTHSLLMGKNIPIIEGLRLDDVPGGSYLFFCLPLNIVGLESAPARAVLISQHSPEQR